jgi:hypothetical protein
MTDFDAIIQAATDKKTFNVLDAVKDKHYPQDITTVYTDVNAAYEIHRLERQIADLGPDDHEAINLLDEEIAGLKEKIKATALTFRLRGIGRGLKDAIIKEGELEFPWTDKTKPNPAEYGPGGEWTNRKFLAAHIVDVTTADGSVDAHKWNEEEIRELRGDIPDESFLELIRLMRDLSFASTYFDASVTPDFS